MIASTKQREIFWPNYFKKCSKTVFCVLFCQTESRKCPFSVSRILEKTHLIDFKKVDNFAKFFEDRYTKVQDLHMPPLTTAFIQ